MSEHTHDLEVDIIQGGLHVGHLDCRVRFTFKPGRAAITTRWPGEPAEDPEVHVTERWILGARPIGKGWETDAFGRMAYFETPPLDWQRALIDAWLDDHGGDLITAAEKAAGNDADERGDAEHERRREAMEAAE